MTPEEKERFKDNSPPKERVNDKRIFIFIPFCRKHLMPKKAEVGEAVRV